MTPLASPLLCHGSVGHASEFNSCCSSTGMLGVHFRKSVDESTPRHFTAADRRRHHHQALFFVETENDGVRLPDVGTPVDFPLSVKPLSLWGMVAIIFFAVSGGPFGSEEAISSVGPFWVLLGFVIFPIIWSIPEALMTSELSTMFPGNGGYVFWTTASFGPRVVFLQGAWSWLSNVTSIAVYPHLLLEYLKAIESDGLNNVWIGRFFLIFFTVGMSYVNYRGLHIIGNGGAVAIAVVLFPFLLMFICGFNEIVWENLLVAVPTSELSPLGFVKFLNIMFWNLNSWENCSVLSGEIDNPQQKLPRAIGIALLITVGAYLVPLTVGIGVMNDTDPSEWTAGYFQAVGYHIGGKWMSILVLVAATFGCIGQYQSILCSSSYSLQSMGEMGMLPAYLAKQSRYGTPSIGIAIATGIILGLTSFGFVDIVQLLNSVYCLALLVEFATLINLRVKCPNMNRPFRIGLSVGGLCVMVFPAVCTVAAMLIVPPLYGEYMSTIYMVGGTVCVLLTYEIVEFGRRKAWFDFCDNPPRDEFEVISRLRVF